MTATPSRPLLACLTCLTLVLGARVESSVVHQTPSTSAPPPAAPVTKPRFRQPLNSVLQGTWEGSLARRPPFDSSARNGPLVNSALELRILIEGPGVRVFLEDSGKWIEAMPGRFTLTRVLSSASIVAFNTKGDETGGWIENWSIAVTAINDDSLRAEWTRVVSNIDPTPDALPTFSMAATGVLRRVSR